MPLHPIVLGNFFDKAHLHTLSISLLPSKPLFLTKLCALYPESHFRIYCRRTKLYIPMICPLTTRFITLQPLSVFRFQLSLFFLVSIDGLSLAVVFTRGFNESRA